MAQRGHLVTASVRSEAKAQEILALHPSWKNQLSFASVADVALKDVFDEVFSKAVDGFDFVIHTASPVKFDVTDIQKDLLDPAVQG
jgi:putative NADH-flavin reductase